MITTADSIALGDPHAPRVHVTCEFGMNESSSSLHDAYGGMSARNAGRLGQAQLRPLVQYLGFGPQAGSHAAAMQQQRLAGATGPLASIINQLRGFAPGVYGQAQQIGGDIANRGQTAYDQFQQALGTSMGDVNAYGTGARQANDLASRYANRAANPLADEDLYQVAQRRVMQQLGPQLAARGLEGATGAGAQAVTDATRGLATDFAGQRRQDQYNSLGALEQAGQSGTQIAGARAGLASSGMDAVTQLGQLLQSRYGIPMQAVGGILQMLMTGTQPSLALTQATAPQLGQESSGWRLL